MWNLWQKFLIMSSIFKNYRWKICESSRNINVKFVAKFWKSLSILKNHFKISGKYFEKSLLPNCPDWKENSTMIKKSYVPFYQSLIFLFLLAVVASVSKNTCISIFFNKFSSNIEKFSAVGLEFFNITFEFIEKNLNTRVLRHGNNNS